MKENVAYDFVSAFLAGPSMSCSFYLDSLCDRRLLVAHPIYCGVLLPASVQNSTQHLCVVPM